MTTQPTAAAPTISVSILAVKTHQAPRTRLWVFDFHGNSGDRNHICAK